MDMTNKENSVTTGRKVINKKGKTKVRMQIKEMTFISLMGALAAVLTLLRFPIPFMPPFMAFDLAGVVEMIGGFMFGPVAAFFIILLKILLQLVMQGSNSIGTGELQNILLSCAYVMPALLIYRRKTKKRAVIGMIAGTLTVSVAAIFSNLYFIIPFYVKLFGMTMDDIIAMCHAVNPAMKDALSMALFGILPFNIIKYGCCSVLTLLLYKHLSRAVKSFINK